MAFEDLKDKLQDQLAALRDRIEESPTYHSLREQYENLSPNAQKGLIFGVIFAAVLFFCYIPFSYFESSGTYVTEFNDKRSVIRQLLRASRLASQAGSVSNPPESGALVEMITNHLGKFSLLPEQNAGINLIESSALGGSLAPAGIVQEGIAVNLKQLNLKQIVDIGYDLQNLVQGVRLVGMAMTPSEKDTRYFDVVYQVARFSMPGVSAGAGADAGGAEAPQKSGGRGRTGSAPRPTPAPSNSGGSRPRFSPPPQGGPGFSPPPTDGNGPPQDFQDEGGAAPEPEDFEGE